MERLVIGNKSARVPVIQGGMGIGVSRGRLAGAVAKAGGIGLVSTVQVGYDEPDFRENPQECNIRALKKHIQMAKEQADGGLVGVNAMVALRDYEAHVKAAVEAGADVVVSGAGLPVALPKLVAGSDTKIAPIVSSEKAAVVILRMWEKKHNATADFVVIEGPKAGGHLGFSKEQIQEDCDGALDYDEEIRKIIAVVKGYEEKFGKKIPVIVAGGVFDADDIRHMRSLGADGVQIASRFVATEECDADIRFKEAYVNAKAEDVRIIQSPVGMPGRAVANAFLDRVSQGRQPVSKCLGCLSKCKPAETPYCITEALVKAVTGDVENGLVFAGSNVGRIKGITTVSELMEELKEGFED